jgi:hypothetical protein
VFWIGYYGIGKNSKGWNIWRTILLSCWHSEIICRKLKIISLLLTLILTAWKP